MDPFTIEDAKYVAFQLAQTLSLIRGRDLYTKRTVAADNVDLAPFLKRDVEAMNSKRHALNNARDVFLQVIIGSFLFFLLMNHARKESFLSIYYFGSS